MPRTLTTTNYGSSRNVVVVVKLLVLNRLKTCGPSQQLQQFCHQAELRCQRCQVAPMWFLCWPHMYP